MEPRWALIAYETHEAFAVLPVTENFIPLARIFGWTVLGADSDVLVMPRDLPVQSNPRRVIDEPRDYGEA